MKTSTTEFTRLQATVLQQDWKRIGVDVDAAVLRAGDVPDRHRARAISDVHAAVGGHHRSRTCCGACSIPRRCRRSGFNRGHFSDPEIDALIDRATRSTDDAERRALYADVQRRIAEAVAYISLWHKTNVVIARPDVRGVEVSPNADFIFLRNVSKGSAPLAVTER